MIENSDLNEPVLSNTNSSLSNNDEYDNNRNPVEYKEGESDDEALVRDDLLLDKSLKNQTYSF